MKHTYIFLILIIHTLCSHIYSADLTIKKETVVKVFNIKWRTPEDAKKMISPAKSKHGSITVSNYTNQLIVSDLPDNIHQMSRILKEFDRLERFERSQPDKTDQFSIKGNVKNTKGETIMPFGFIVIDKHEVKREILTQLNYHLKNDPKRKVHSKDIGMSIYVTPKRLDLKKIHVNVCLVEKKLVGWAETGEPIIDNYTTEMQGTLDNNKTLKLTAKEYDRPKYNIELRSSLNINKKSDLSVSYY